MSAPGKVRGVASVVALALVAGASAACGPRGSAAGDPAADSTSVADSVTNQDSTASRTDSAAPRPDSATTKAPGRLDSAGTKAPPIGRDSAFGPRFLVDSTGKLIPVEGKKRP